MNESCTPPFTRNPVWFWLESYEFSHESLIMHGFLKYSWQHNVALNYRGSISALRNVRVNLEHGLITRFFIMTWWWVSCWIVSLQICELYYISCIPERDAAPRCVKVGFLFYFSTLHTNSHFCWLSCRKVKVSHCNLKWPGMHICFLMRS